MVPNSPQGQDDIFNALQETFIQQYIDVFSDSLAPHSIVVIPSLSLDQQILSKIKGHYYYEERLLCLLMLLKMPEMHITYVTSVPISSVIIDYYFHLIPGITGLHAKKRLTLLSCHDIDKISLTDKVLNRPRIIDRIRRSVPHGQPSHLVFFNVTDKEKELAIKLNIPIYGCDPALNYLGIKSGSRQLFKELNIKLPKGFEHLKNEEDVITALAILKADNPSMHKAVIKMNDGFSGDGNAIFSFEGAPKNKKKIYGWIKENMENKTKIVAEKVNYQQFFVKFCSMGGIVEEFLDGTVITSPSVQCRINPLGEICIISTHDQCLGGESNQVFLGAFFPANQEYAAELSAISYKISEKMNELGVRGRYGIDFMSRKVNDVWEHYAIEINLRKGGTTHPFLMLQFLTNGEYDPKRGVFILPDGTERYYFATDNLQSDKFKGLIPDDLIDIAMHHSLHYNQSKEEGVIFHLISTLSQYGKIGLTSIGKSRESAEFYYKKVIYVLDQETAT
ncbi:MAG: carboxylate-amine ligase [Saprospiraceae bacterium]|nr:carboxylate-amine ligase [Saprospiraceae bacterium]